MLQNQWKEVRDAKVSIVDFDAETVKTAIGYFYDQPPSNLDAQLAASLLCFADKYFITGLKVHMFIRFFCNIF